mmetsp:Transcript_3268/g.9661  ORF Transcript_3268/g.9661 Transcript_3268/m.9661 type:complete len:205 (+) Transcript_3268:2344-2958(+)
MGRPAHPGAGGGVVRRLGAPAPAFEGVAARRDPDAGYHFYGAIVSGLGRLLFISLYGLRVRRIHLICVVRRPLRVAGDVPRDEIWKSVRRSDVLGHPLEAHRRGGYESRVDRGLSVDRRIAPDDVVDRHAVRKDRQSPQPVLKVLVLRAARHGDPPPRQSGIESVELLLRLFSEIEGRLRGEPVQAPTPRGAQVRRGCGPGVGE